MCSVDVIWRPSPNFHKRENPIQFIVLHGTWMDSDAAALERLCDPIAEVSCHYFIAETGQVYQLVADDNVAYHAGVSCWGDITGLNRHSIGIEISNPGPQSGVPYYEEQMQSLEVLLADLIERYNLPKEAVLGHEDIAPGRKDDPGPHFDWNRLEQKGLACRNVKSLLRKNHTVSN